MCDNVNCDVVHRGTEHNRQPVFANGRRKQREDISIKCREYPVSGNSKSVPIPVKPVDTSASEDDHYVRYPAILRPYRSKLKPVIMLTNNASYRFYNASSTCLLSYIIC